jgi:hypothetical protein
MRTSCRRADGRLLTRMIADSESVEHEVPAWPTRRRTWWSVTVTRTQAAHADDSTRAGGLVAPPPPARRPPPPTPAPPGRAAPGSGSSDDDDVGSEGLCAGGRVRKGGRAGDTGLLFGWPRGRRVARGRNGAGLGCPDRAGWAGRGGCCHAGVVGAGRPEGGGGAGPLY